MWQLMNSMPYLDVGVLRGNRIAFLDLRRIEKRLRRLKKEWDNDCSETLCLGTIKNGGIKLVPFLHSTMSVHMKKHWRSSTIFLSKKRAKIYLYRLTSQPRMTSPSQQGTADLGWLLDRSTTCLSSIARKMDSNWTNSTSANHKR